MLIWQPYTSTSHYSKAKSLSDYNGGVGTMETCTLFLISNMQYIATCFAFTMGKPFREEMYKNIGFIVNIGVILVIEIYMNLFPGQWLRKILEVQI